MNLQRCLTAEELHDAYSAGRLTPFEVNDVTLTRIADHNPRLNAYVRVDESGSRIAARLSTNRYESGAPLSALDGVPIGVKDNIAVTGLARPGAIAAYKNCVASADAAVVSRLRAAGAVITGMLNMDEAAFGTTTESPLYGRCQNPLRHDFTAGGSSGGSASAVASGLCLASLGTDTLGSVRIPASYCGLVGFKPSHGVVDVDGVMALSPTLDHVGVLARTVRDAAIVFSAIADRRLGWEGNEALGPELQNGLILGVLDTDDIAAGDVATSFRQVVESLERAGVQVVAVDRTGIDFGQWRKAGLLIAEAEAALVHEEALARDPEGFSSSFRDAMAYARRQSALRMSKAYTAMEDARRWLAKEFTRCHAILSPTAPQKAFSFGVGAQPNQAEITTFANLAGVPALALPVADGGDLPMSVQLVGPFGSDDWLLALGRHIANLLPTYVVENA
jgi:aspartyl-tRNA(Asn)/glutamyl-tRNA(Gln) amidotransferase subunit A